MDAIFELQSGRCADLLRRSLAMFAGVRLDICVRLRQSMAVLSTRALFSGDGVQLADVACSHGRGRGQTGEQSGGHALVFVRRGCFVRSADGVESLLDPTLAYCMNPGEEQRFDHPHDHGDDCTWLGMDAELAASLWGGDPTLPSQPLAISSTIDVEHRLLLRAAAAGASAHELMERAVLLSARALERADSRRVAAGRASTKRAHRALTDGVRELLAANVECSLPDLARTMAVSPHHLSRTFRATTGYSISRHRMRLRTGAVLERLAGGERNLARLAADFGFADQSHLCRVVRGEAGETPSALRAALA
jgi:AraC-like DNA-binding protein